MPSTGPDVAPDLYVADGRSVRNSTGGHTVASDDNTLELGRSRIGLMIDGLKETPRGAAKLERTDRVVELDGPAHRRPPR